MKPPVLAFCALAAVATSRGVPDSTVEFAPDGTVRAVRSASRPEVPLDQAITALGPQARREAAALASEASRPTGAQPAVAMGMPAEGRPVAPSATALALNERKPIPVLPPDPPLAANVLIPKEGAITVSPKRELGMSIVPNPFDVRFVSASALDEYSVQTSGDPCTRSPAAFVSGRSYVAGDRVQGFVLHRLRGDGIVLERDGLYFFIPTGVSVKIRLPKQ